MQGIELRGHRDGAGGTGSGPGELGSLGGSGEGRQEGGEEQRHPGRGDAEGEQRSHGGMSGRGGTPDGRRANTAPG